MQWSTPSAAEGLPTDAADLGGSGAHPRAPEGRPNTPLRREPAASADAPGDRHLGPGRLGRPGEAGTACGV